MQKGGEKILVAAMVRKTEEKEGTGAKTSRLVWVLRSRKAAKLIARKDRKKPCAPGTRRKKEATIETGVVKHGASQGRARRKLNTS